MHRDNKSRAPARRAGLAAVLSLCLTVAGCGDAGQTLTDWWQPPGAGEMAARVAALAAQNKVPEAIAAGERFLGKHPDPQGHVRTTLARLYTEQGDPVSAVRHLSQAQSGAAANAAAVPAPAPASPPPAMPPAAAPPPVAAAPATPVAPVAPVAPTPVDASAGDASARVHQGGIEVRAGDASVFIRK